MTAVVDRGGYSRIGRTQPRRGSAARSLRHPPRPLHGVGQQGLERLVVVHPLVVARYMDDGEVIVLRGKQASKADAYAHSADERALIRFLDKHFPERRQLARVKGVQVAIAK